MKYNLIFVLNGGDEKKPLVQSQTFDQAQLQTCKAGPFKPGSTSVWIFASFRSLFQLKEIKFRKSLRVKYPSIKIYFFYGSSRFKEFPAKFLLKAALTKNEKLPIIFHSRGEFAHQKIKSYLPTNKEKKKRFILDVRGYWPAESIYRYGVHKLEDASDEQLKEFKNLKKKFIANINDCDGLITVSNPLSDIIKESLTLPKPINIIPCAVKSIAKSIQTKAIRDRLNLKEQTKIIVYSGGYAKYQHLEDLTFPFVKLLINKSESLHFLVLSQNLIKMKEIAKSCDFPSNRVSFLTAKQEEVQGILSGCNLGLLIRKPSLVNRIAQPVKVGEYLAAGVPICYHDGISGAEKLIKEYKAGVPISIAEKSTPDWIPEANNVISFLEGDYRTRENAMLLAREHFIWDKQIEKQRSFYHNVLVSP